MERSTKNFELLGLSLITNYCKSFKNFLKIDFWTLFHMKRHDVMYRIIKKQSDKIAVLFYLAPKYKEIWKIRIFFLF